MKLYTPNILVKKQKINQNNKTNKGAQTFAPNCINSGWNQTWDEQSVFRNLHLYWLKNMKTRNNVQNQKKKKQNQQNNNNNNKQQWIESKASRPLVTSSCDFTETTDPIRLSRGENNRGTSKGWWVKAPPRTTNQSKKSFISRALF